MTDEGMPFVLRDGRTMLFRPIRPDDIEEMLALGRRLSPRSVRMRFFTSRFDFEAAATRKFIEHLATVDYEKRMAYIGYMPGETLIRAIARYETETPGVAEVAFTVDDEFGGQGIATHLLYLLADYARQRGYHEFNAMTLSENSAMLGVFRNSGFPCETVQEGDTVRVVMDITRPPVKPVG